MDILDDLTQLHNRRGCMGLLSRHIAMSNDKQSLLGLIWGR